MEKAGIWQAVQPKLVFGENVSQTLQYAETGNVDVAIVALSLSVPAAAEGNSRPVYTDPRGAARTARPGAGGHQGDDERGRSAAFAAYVNGPKGRPIMRKYGFVLPGEQPAQ